MTFAVEAWRTSGEVTRSTQSTLLEHLAVIVATMLQESMCHAVGLNDEAKLTTIYGKAGTAWYILTCRPLREEDWLFFEQDVEEEISPEEEDWLFFEQDVEEEISPEEEAVPLEEDEEGGTI